MISGSALGVTMTYLPLLLNERTDMSLSLIGLIVASWIGMGSIASFSYGKIASYIKRKNILLVSYFFIGLTGIILTYFVNPLILLVIFLIMGVSTFLTFPALFAFVSESTHESVEGRTFGTIFTLQLGGGTILLFLGGILSDIYGIWMPFLILGSLSLILTIGLIINYKKPVISLK